MRKLLKKIASEVATYPEVFIGAPGFCGMTAGANYILAGSFTLLGLPTIPIAVATACFIAGLYALTSIAEVAS